MAEIPALSMAGVAALAWVQRPVVSMWRSRYGADAVDPFPEPLGTGALTFNAQEIGEWLSRTGLGNNPEAAAETALHSTATHAILEDLDAATALLLLQSATGGQIAETDAVDAVVAAQGLDAPHLIDAASDSFFGLLERSDQVAAVDQLVEAAYDGSSVLAHVVHALASAQGHWGACTLTDDGAGFIGELLGELVDQVGGRLTPSDDAALVLLAAFLRRRDLDATVELGAHPRLMQSPEQLAVWRWARSLGHTVTPAPRQEDAVHALVVHHDPGPRDPVEFFARVEDLAFEAADGGARAVVVIGPAALLLDPLSEGSAAHAARNNTLGITIRRYAPVRYRARLPKGLMRTGGQRQLALWIMALPPKGAAEVTVTAEHAQSSLDAAEVQAIVQDAVASTLGGRRLVARALTRSTRLQTQDALGESGRTPQRSLHVEPLIGGDELARLWELDDGVLPKQLSFAAAQPDGTDPVLPWSEAVPALARDRAGYRIPLDIIGPPDANRAVVIGADELRDPQSIGTRTVDRFQLIQRAPRVTFTEAQDVIYVASGAPAAWLDDVGGHAVLAPARVLRVRPLRETAPRLRVLSPVSAVADIQGQRATDRKAWRLRTVPRDQVDTLAAATANVRTQLAELEQRRARLEELNGVVVGGITAGVLRVEIENNHARTPNKES